MARFVAVVLAVVASALLAVLAAARPNGMATVLLWANTPSLAELGSTGPGETVTPQRLAKIVGRLVLAEPGDFLVIADGPLASVPRGQSHLKALRPALVEARSQVALGKVISAADAPSSDAVVAAFLHNQIPFNLVAIENEAALASLSRSNGDKPTVYTIDLSTFADAEAALASLVLKFSSESAPFVAVYASAPAEPKVTESPSEKRFRGRELRSIDLSDASTTAAEGDLKIFERLTFVSAAIWMGAVVFFILLFVIIPAILCTMEIQGPNQFEKKPLLNTAQ